MTWVSIKHSRTPRKPSMLIGKYVIFNISMYARMWVNDRFLCHVCALYPDRSLTGDAIVHQSNSS